MARRDRLIRNHLRLRYLVTTADEEVFDGVLFDADDLHIVLVETEQVAPNGERLAVDGQVWLPRPRVKYMQLVTR